MFLTLELLLNLLRKLFQAATNLTTPASSGGGLHVLDASHGALVFYYPYDILSFFSLHFFPFFWSTLGKFYLNFFMRIQVLDNGIL